jgi:hypothetical protein
MYHQSMRKFARAAAASALIAAGLGLAGLGAATDAHAGQLPEYSCPGHPHWSFSRCMSTRH